MNEDVRMKISQSLLSVERVRRGGLVRDFVAVHNEDKRKVSSDSRASNEREGKGSLLDDNVDLDSLLGLLLEDVVESVLLLSGSSHVEFGGEPEGRGRGRTQGVSSSSTFLSTDGNCEMGRTTNHGCRRISERAK